MTQIDGRVQRNSGSRRLDSLHSKIFQNRMPLDNSHGFVNLSIARAACCLFFFALIPLAAPGQKPSGSAEVAKLYQDGLQFIKAGDLKTAQSMFERVVKLAPNAPEGHNSLGWVLMQTGKPKEAVTEL